MSRRNEGLTLLEVAIAGAILLGGLAVLANLVRTTLSSTTPGFGQGMQVGPVVEHQLKLHATTQKSWDKGTVNTSAVVRVGSESIYTSANPGTILLGPVTGYGGRPYRLVEMKITAKMTVNNNVTSPTDPLVGFTQFWKLDVTDGSGRAGL